jgi:hypothetical protein
MKSEGKCHQCPGNQEQYQVPEILRNFHIRGTPYENKFERVLENLSTRLGPVIFQRYEKSYRSTTKGEYFHDCRYGFQTADRAKRCPKTR